MVSISVPESRQESNNPPAIQKTEYRLTIDKPGAPGKHPIACYHFSMDDFDALSAMAKSEVDAGFTVTIEVVSSIDNCIDYDDRTAGGQAGTTRGH